ncbi:MAG: Gldg family protein [Myxococcota bacterium]
MNVREWFGRQAFAAGVAIVAVGHVIGGATDPVLGDLAGLVAALGFAVALVAWTLDGEVPLPARAADVAGAGLAVVAVLLPWLLKPDTLAAWPAGWQTAAVVALLLVGSVARSVQGAYTAVPVLAILGGVLAVVAGGEGFVHAAFTRHAEILVAGAGALLVAYAALDARQVGETLGSRSVRYGGGAVMLTALAAALAAGSYALAVRNDHTFDLTRDKRYTLSDQASRVAKELGFDVTVTAYFGASAYGRDQFSSLIDRFHEANPRITVEWVDPLRDPRRAAAADVTSDQGTVVLEGNGRTRRLDWEITEDELTRALVMLGSDTDHTVCWSLGHGEPDPDDEYAQDGLGGARLDLEGMNYTVQNVTIGNTGIPAECRILVVARPSTDWLPPEREALAAFVASGGRALLLLEPGTVPELAREMERYGILVGDDVVLDLDDRYRPVGIQDPSFLVLTADGFGTHPITRNLTSVVFAPFARTVRASQSPPEGVDVRDLLRTSPASWAESDIEGTEVGQDPDELSGELPILALAEVKDPAALRVQVPGGDDASPAPEAPEAPAGDLPSPADGDAAHGGNPADVPASAGVPADFTPAPGGRIVVVGDADFASQQLLGLGNDRDLFLNTVAWLADEEDQIGERPKDSEALEIGAGADALWCLFSILVVPGIAAGVALITLLRRRSL